jgi:hypothetical protein
MSDVHPDRIASPVIVEVKNWPDPPAKLPYIKNSTFKTHVVDPANVNAKYVQICNYEPRRVRLAILVIDVAVVLTQDVPTISPDTTSATAAPASGIPLAPSTQMYEFFGPEAMWLNALTAVTRVAVVKEYN